MCFDLCERLFLMHQSNGKSSSAVYEIRDEVIPLLRFRTSYALRICRSDIHVYEIDIIGLKRSKVIPYSPLCNH